ncbi:MAG: hypothetical protein ABFS30_00880 [Pseudomonadota bacterium]
MRGRVQRQVRREARTARPDQRLAQRLVGRVERDRPTEAPARDPDARRIDVWMRDQALERAVGIGEEHRRRDGQLVLDDALHLAAVEAVDAEDRDPHLERAHHVLVVMSPPAHRPVTGHDGRDPALRLLGPQQPAEGRLLRAAVELSQDVDELEGIRRAEGHQADAAVGEIGEKLAALDYVTLCYRRPRRLPAWPYNLFCMIHGRDRATVEALAEEAAAAAGAADCPRSVLFSTRQFKQRGARYAKCAAAGP